MNLERLRTLLLLSCVLLAAGPLAAQSKKAATKPETASPPAAAPKVGVAVQSVLDRRTTSDFPSPSLTVNLNIEGEDAGKVASARARVVSASDDTGASLLQDEKKKMMTIGEGWQQAREDKPPSIRLELASPSRKAKTVASLEGVLESYLPSRDPAATVRIDAILAKKDKPAPVVAALASKKIRIQVLSKEGLERAKKQAEEKKKAEAAKKKKKEGKKEGLEGMAEAMAEGMADVFGTMFDRLFMTAGENDLILKVEDPGKKLFSFDLAARDGKPIANYGTMEVENYRIVKMFEPIPQGASLLVHLKTPKAFAETPFTLSNLKLP